MGVEGRGRGLGVLLCRWMIFLVVFHLLLVR
jgi:hypothetical protein